jgi:lambda family phage portal protein
MPKQNIFQRVFSRQPKPVDPTQYARDRVAALAKVDEQFPGTIDLLKNSAARETVQQIKAGVNVGVPGVYGSWSRSAGAKFPGGLSTAFGGITFNNWQLRQQARDVYEDSVQARAMVDRFADTVVDSGLTVEPDPMAQILGITQEQAQIWSEKTRTAFSMWCHQKTQHRAGLFNFYQIQRLLAIYDERDNDTFMRLFYSDDKSLINPLQFEVLDTNQIRGDAVTSTILVGRFYDGIERDASGVETVYHIWVQQEAPTYEPVDIPRIGPGGKRNMLHGFVPSYGGQGRGLSGLGNTLQEFEQLTDLSQATVIKAINHASINMYVKPSATAPSSNPFDQLGNLGQGVSSIQVGAPGSSSAGNAAMVTNPTVTVTPIEEAAFNKPGVNVFSLDMGEDLVPFESKTPSEAYGAFVDAFCSYLCAARGMPLEVLLMRFNANYSASRAAILLFWRVACMKRDFMDSNFIGPTFEEWLGCEVAAGRIACPGWSDPILRAAWCHHRINGTPMPNIDPSMTAEADQKLIGMGAKTLDDVARETNGSSGKTNRAALVKQFKEMTDAGIAPWLIQSPQQTGQLVPQKKQEK